MIIRNEIYTGANRRKSLIDLSMPIKGTKEVVLFVHGYKGYKDWGAWNRVEKYFFNHGIGFAKLNLSHNGGTIENPIDFPDLEAFGENRYTYELSDIENAIQWLHNKINLTNYNLTLIGHSRGGGVAILSGMNAFVKKVVTWAAIDDISSRFPIGNELEKWKKEGVRFIKNGRTKQDMPHYFSFYEDFLDHKERLQIKKYALELKKLHKPCLHIHGENDEAVFPHAVYDLSNWTSGVSILIPNTGHTFDTKHPWEENQLPEAMEKVCAESIQFIINN